MVKVALRIIETMLTSLSGRGKGKQETNITPSQTSHWELGLTSSTPTSLIHYGSVHRNIFQLRLNE